MVTSEFVARLKLAKVPAWRLATEAGIAPWRLSKLLRGTITLTPDDRQRLIAIGGALGLCEGAVFKPSEHAGNTKES